MTINASKSCFLFITVLMTAGLSQVSLSQGDGAVVSDWPCIQGYVPEVAIVVVWPEPVDDAITGEWKKEKSLKPVVRDFGNLETFNDSDRMRLAEFAESIPESTRLHTLNVVASGIVDEFNKRRKEYFNGIRKYTRQQIAVARQIEEHLNELADLAEKTDAAAEQRKKEIVDTTAWQQRIFDKRERAMVLLCETPVELETLMGNVLRELAQYLP